MKHLLLSDIKLVCPIISLLIRYNSILEHSCCSSTVSYYRMVNKDFYFPGFVPTIAAGITAFTQKNVTSQCDHQCKWQIFPLLGVRN